MMKYSGTVTKPRIKPTTQEAGQDGALTCTTETYAAGHAGEPRLSLLLGRDVASRGRSASSGKGRIRQHISRILQN